MSSLQRHEAALNMTISTHTPVEASSPVLSRPAISKDRLILGLVISVVALYLIISLLLPLLSMLVRSVQDSNGTFVGLNYFSEYLGNPALSQSIGNTLKAGTIVTTIVVSISFLFAYGLTRTRMPLKPMFKVGRFAATFCPVQPSNLWEIPVIFFCLSLLTLIPRTAKERA
ncbi:MAG: hypothetical protein ACR2PX_20450, partial [Endozoicomonas sp.]